MATLWEKFMALFTSPEKGHLVFNPLGVQPGKFINLDELDYRDVQFKVAKISEYTREIGKKVFRFVDYHLKNTDGSKKVVLRYNPMDNPLPGTTNTCNVLLLTLHDEFTYSEEFYKLPALHDAKETFDINVDMACTEPVPGTVVQCRWKGGEQFFPGKITEVKGDDIHVAFDDGDNEWTNADMIVTRNMTSYTRMNGVNEPYLAKVASLSLDAPEDLVSEELKYWDFFRDAEDEAKQSYTEFLFIEMSNENGWFQLWKGVEFSPTLIKV